MTRPAQRGRTPIELEAVHAFVDHAGVEGAAAPARVAGMARELHAHQRPDLAAKPLQRKDCRRIADVAVDDMRLDGEDRVKHGAQRDANLAAWSKAPKRPVRRVTGFWRFGAGAWADSVTAADPFMRFWRSSAASTSRRSQFVPYAYQKTVSLVPAGQLDLKRRPRAVEVKPPPPDGPKYSESDGNEAKARGRAETTRGPVGSSDGGAP